jgi:hypothetical protein
MDLKPREVLQRDYPTTLRHTTTREPGATAGDSKRHTGRNCCENFVLVAGDYDFFRMACKARGIV